MELWWKHISPIAETWAYCLMRNHFHAAVWIKEEVPDLTGFTDNSVNQNRGVGMDHRLTDTIGNLSGLKDPSKYFSNFFNAYARGVNIATQRTGALFERPFKRIPVEQRSLSPASDGVYSSESAKT